MTNDVPATREDLLAALRADRQEFVDRLRALPESAFDRGAYEAGWTARQVLAHVASIEWTYPRLLEMGAPDGEDSEKRATTAADRVKSERKPPPDMDAYNRRQVEKRASASIDELLDEFARNRDRTIAAIESAEDEVLQRNVQSLGGVSGPIVAVVRDVAVLHVRQHLADILAAGESDA